MAIPFATLLPKSGHMNGQNMYAVHFSCTILSYMYVCLLVLVTTFIYSVHGHGSFKIDLVCVSLNAKFLRVFCTLNSDLCHRI